MELIIVRNDQEGAQAGFDIIKEALDAKSLNVLGLATGSTPISLYNLLTESDLDFSNVVSVNLDEYIGIGSDHVQSYNYFMNKHLFGKKPFKKSYLPNGLETDEAKECARYNKIIEENPMDIQILGIGENGHIGFNEPGASFDSLTEKVALTESTIAANARMFDDINDVPRFAYSMGIKTILSAKKIILFAYGAKKAEAIRQMIEEKPSTDCPASALQLHDDVTVIVDEAAASLLSR